MTLMVAGYAAIAVGLWLGADYVKKMFESQAPAEKTADAPPAPSSGLLSKLGGLLGGEAGETAPPAKKAPKIPRGQVRIAFIEHHQPAKKGASVILRPYSGAYAILDAEGAAAAKGKTGPNGEARHTLEPGDYEIRVPGTPAKRSFTLHRGSKAGMRLQVMVETRG